MAVKADEVRHPDQIEDDDFDWAAVAEGEPVDAETHRTLTLAHRAVAKFPELKGKYKAYAGAAVVVSSVATLMAGVAITRKMKHGMSRPTRRWHRSRPPTSRRRFTWRHATSATSACCARSSRRSRKNDSPGD